MEQAELNELATLVGIRPKSHEMSKIERQMTWTLFEVLHATITRINELEESGGK